MAVREEIATRDQFENSHSAAHTPVLLDVEREVLGGDYGANGYTTRLQADLLAAELSLRPGVRLLDLGAGCGWPGLYLSGSTGCDVVCCDLTVSGMRAVSARAGREGTASRVAAVVASARHLPFHPESFDAIVHTDVLC